MDAAHLALDVLGGGCALFGPPKNRGGPMDGRVAFGMA
jgi:hypothetical protein